MEYSAVFDAMERIAVGDFDEEALEFAVWKQDNGAWSSCELWRMHEIMTDQQEVTMFKVSFQSKFSFAQLVLNMQVRPS